ncbi:MAG TPA: hypothetical protein VLL97_06390 [Acidobacteriota bacterium]|nr:hypothetical protein [Acidobacteriota bacterium]
MLKMSRIFILALAMTCIASGSALAQTGFGLRAGATADPNQFHFGGHYSSDQIIYNLVFRPNLEIGIGSNITMIAANLEFAYLIPIPDADFSAYIGAGPALVYRKFGESIAGNSSTGGGFNILLGLEHRNGLFAEMKVGAIDSPDFKFTIGTTF